MLIEITLVGMMSGEEKVVTIDDMISPSNGYTQSYAEDAGNWYADYKATEQLGDSDYWEFLSARYVKERITA